MAGTSDAPAVTIAQWTVGILQSTELPSASGPRSVTRYFNLSVTLFSLIGMAANVVVVTVLATDRALRKRMTTTLILNQSVVDLTCSVVLLITYAYEAASPISEYSSFAEKAVCLLLDAKLLVFCTLNASTFCLTAITLERYLMVVHPIAHRNWTNKPRLIAMATVAWTIGYAWNAGPTIPFVWVEDGKCMLFVWPDRQLQSTFGIIYTTGTFLLPAVFLVFAYGRMLVVLTKRATQTSTKISSAQANMTKTMVVVTAVFLVCWTPNQIYYLLFNIGFNLRLGSPTWMVTQFLCFTTCCCNPFIYAFKYDGVRGSLKKRLGKWRGQVDPQLESTNHTASSENA